MKSYGKYWFLLGVVFLHSHLLSAMEEEVSAKQRFIENNLVLRQNLSGISEGKDIVVAIGNKNSLWVCVLSSSSAFTMPRVSMPRVSAARARAAARLRSE